VEYERKRAVILSLSKDRAERPAHHGSTGSP